MPVRSRDQQDKGRRSRVPAVLLGVVVAVALCLSLLVGTMLWIVVKQERRWFGPVNVAGTTGNSGWNQGVSRLDNLHGRSPIWMVRLGDYHWVVMVDR